MYLFIYLYINFAGCGRVLDVSKSGTLSSPGYPLSYGHNQHCTWILNAHPGSKLTASFMEFNLQALNGTHCADFVQILDGSEGKQWFGSDWSIFTV